MAFTDVVYAALTAGEKTAKKKIAILEKCSEQKPKAVCKAILSVLLQKCQQSIEEGALSRVRHLVELLANTVSSPAHAVSIAELLWAPALNVDGMRQLRLLLLQLLRDYPAIEAIDKLKDHIAAHVTALDEEWEIIGKVISSMFDLFKPKILLLSGREMLPIRFRSETHRFSATEFLSRCNIPIFYDGRWLIPVQGVQMLLLVQNIRFEIM